MFSKSVFNAKVKIQSKKCFKIYKSKLKAKTVKKENGQQNATRDSHNFMKIKNKGEQF